MQNRPDEFPGSGEEKNELDIGHIIKEYRSGSSRQNLSDTAAARQAESGTSSAPAPELSAPLTPGVGGASPAAAPEGGKHKQKKSAGQILLSMLDGAIPHKGDGILEIVRKCVFVIALTILAGSLAYLAYDMAIIPNYSKSLYADLHTKYDPTKPVVLPEEAKDFDFLPGMSDSFKLLYMDNTDLRGFLSYHTNKKDNFLDIDLPIVRGVDNEYYLTHNFYKDNDKNGCLFFDIENVIETPEDRNKITIVYGHNMASGNMFAPFNKFLGNIAYIRSAPTLTMNTVFEEAKYKVFAVVVANVDAEDGPPFNYLRTGNDFSEAAFLKYINDVRARSIWDFESAVDIQADDELLILSTCTTVSGVHFDNGRVAVIARKVRPGESEEVNVNLIKKNDDVIMPLAWYVNQGLEPHAFYTDPGYTVPGMSAFPGGTTPPTVPTVAPPKPTDPVPPDVTTPTGEPQPPTQAPDPVDPTDPTEPTAAPPTDTPPTEAPPTETPPDPTDPVEPTEPEPTEPVGPVEPTETTSETEPTDPPPQTEPAEA